MRGVVVRWAVCCGVARCGSAVRRSCADVVGWSARDMGVRFLGEMISTPHPSPSHDHLTHPAAPRTPPLLPPRPPRPPRHCHAASTAISMSSLFLLESLATAHLAHLARSPDRSTNRDEVRMWFGFGVSSLVQFGLVLVRFDLICHCVKIIHSTALLCSGLVPWPGFRFG